MYEDASAQFLLKTPANDLSFAKDKLQDLPFRRSEFLLHEFRHFDLVLQATSVSLDDFKSLTKIPIIIYYGDNIPETLSPNAAADGWRARLIMARKWRDVVNKHGGDVTVVHLPEIGIKGNTHFPFSDLNNIEIADLMSKWLKDKKLD